MQRSAAERMQYRQCRADTTSAGGAFAFVGVMQARLEAMKEAGIDTEFHVYPGLGHGFGLGTGTSAEGWIEDAIAFWERQM